MRAKNDNFGTNATCLLRTSDVVDWSTKFELSSSSGRTESTDQCQQLAEGRLLGRYRLVRLLGEGTFGWVWLATDEELLRQVAIKVPKKERFQTAADASQFLVEAQTAARLDHPHIVPVYDIGRADDGAVFVVSKLIDGCTLRDKFKNEVLTYQQTAGLMAMIARALHHAHVRHFVHRDVKPVNILIEDSTGYPYLADFGLTISDQNHQDSEPISGTPCYMSPEQVRGEQLDGRSDLFSLGIILYEMLTGSRPFCGTLARVLEEIVYVAPIKPRDINPSIPGELERICLQALSKCPDERHATAADLASALEGWITSR